MQKFDACDYCGITGIIELKEPIKIQYILPSVTPTINIRSMLFGG